MEEHDFASSPSSSTAGPVPDLSNIPPILILSAHFNDQEVHELGVRLRRHHAVVTSDPSKARVFIGRVGTKRRAEFELRSRKFKVEPAEEEAKEIKESKRLFSHAEDADGPANKRRKTSVTSSKPITIDYEDSVTEDESAIVAAEESETETETDGGSTAVGETPNTTPAKSRKKSATPPPVFQRCADDDIVWIVKADWLDRCVAAGQLLPLGDDLVYRAKVLERPGAPPSTTRGFIKPNLLSTSTPASTSALAVQPETARSILERAKIDASNAPRVSSYIPNQKDGHGSRRFEGLAFTSSGQKAAQAASRTAHLLQQTTSEYEGTDSDTPEPPEWVKRGIKYACQRFTPPNPPNQEFIELLKKIRTARILIDDDIGVRAYSTIIASIAAYPYKFSNPREILRLPGCDVKVANMWVEWKNTGTLQAVEQFENNEAMKVLRQFYEIWGVGAKTARNFYYNHHWTELDDIIEYGWNELDRVQQIGLKYYDEFLQGIPRAEVEQIAEVVRQHAVKLRDERITVTVVGGYRRGKEMSGDVDMIVSHPDLNATAGLVKEIVESLEEAEWITHTLTLSLNNTNRGQNTLPFRTSKQSGVGFDTLDKALVVWQDPHWPTREQDLQDNPRAKNPNIHRRVDIILSPWRTVGCAVMGWSGGTTFQRDLRRYVKHAKGWKFDSSGVRSRQTGKVIQLEGPEGVDGTPEDAERKVFEGLGLEYVPPEMRCTN
ncbi:Nucleotidyltransferase [Westerdykella ornata]|uniref:DNA-directed DNA polymerase n=1 Tax=Westerdykella ornata TaxID=318751 RepID=A0A6A6JPD3_WESOR|nr:Nucleotidyltransferase [Westerdykella ornata]KAF2277768.1 Nucleotidyltransferase [Westerdykella ornata]